MMKINENELTNVVGGVVDPVREIDVPRPDFPPRKPDKPVVNPFYPVVAWSIP